MKAKKRKSTICHNCDSTLEEDFNFCPVCGQSNNDNNITFWILIKEFLDNYLGIDSKMAHSFIPFLLSPGALTNRFQEGKIKHFIHPVRLYLVMSLFYFFIISYLLSGINFSTLQNEVNEQMSTNLESFRFDNDLRGISDSAKFKMVSDTLRQQFPEVEEFSLLYDSILSKYGEDFVDDYMVSYGSLIMPSSDKELPKVERWHMAARDPRISDKAFMDSLAGGVDNWSVNVGGPETQAKIFTQVRQIFKNDEGFKGFLLGNLPLMMFILIPLFAGVLKMIHIRKSHLYIKHIVHALHVHSFAYMVYGLGLLVMFKVLPNNEWRWILAGLMFVGVSTYVYVSFLKVYKQGWFKTLVKFNIVGFIYSIFLQLFFYLEIFISFWYYKG